MSVRAALAKLERSAAKAGMFSTGPCICQGPQVVVYDQKKGPPSEPDRTCDRCGRERERINIRIVRNDPPGTRRVA